MGKVIKMVEMIVYTVVFLCSWVVSWVGDHLYEIDSYGKITFLVIGLLAGGMLLDMIYQRWRDTRK